MKLQRDGPSITSTASRTRKQESSCPAAQAQDAPVLQGKKCWICLEGDKDSAKLLRMPCSCPRFAHQRCLARWQLHSAGTRRETHCEFCDQPLPDWKHAFPLTDKSCSSAVITVSFVGMVRKIGVKPGPTGYASFDKSVRQAFDLPDGAKFNVSFTCEDPFDPDVSLKLKGIEAYDAAVYCAQLTAAKNLAAHRVQLSCTSSLPTQTLTTRVCPSSLSKKLVRLLQDISCTSRQSVDVLSTGRATD
uniref:RING-CH-type domain-containing protein n=1 Tax=Tetraselmis sp. GSL018 TaxID=582737 RepID=A0A061R770_9CHLO|mmetsp:Transcript_12909/g.30619  ORF Transcript_12909/g.30619 Transcript_12909/m.30619 type:complete len:246 (-) Transcript_12909:880-1617(-)|eukprot:CAMPEP_0177591380 /NCGR_PEP_ID=MMETSP0419_2-20121207/7967_1 /TAXON_ID=582737 /ORGANISM="Tetraselmis sp., Strain GSL018" /LENGTH=245 /DNA_ID=CAMNT_0019082119 /DNA_START=125 /DNA_END=862 /DNA_ORIENTATION=+